MNQERREEVYQIDDYEHMNYSHKIKRRQNFHEQVRLQKKAQCRRHREET